MRNNLIHVTSGEKKEKKLNLLELTESGFSPWIADCLYPADIKEAMFWAKSLKERYPDFVDVDGDKIVFKKGFQEAFRKKLCKDLTNVFKQENTVPCWMHCIQELVKPAVTRPWIYEDNAEDEMSFLSSVREGEPYYCIAAFDLDV